MAGRQKHTERSGPYGPEQCREYQRANALRVAGDLFGGRRIKAYFGKLLITRAFAVTVTSSAAGWIVGVGLTHDLGIGGGGRLSLSTASAVGASLELCQMVPGGSLRCRRRSPLRGQV